MIKRLLIAGVVGGCSFAVIAFIIICSMGERVVSLNQPYSEIPNIIAGVASVLLALIIAVVVFIKVKPKRTIVEDIIINKAKIIKAEQEKKLNTLKEDR